MKNIAPGETRHIALEIPVEELRFYDVISRRLMVEEGTYEIYAAHPARIKPFPQKSLFRAEKGEYAI